mgnify:FL=1
MDNVDKRTEKFSGTREVDNFIQWVKEHAKPTDGAAVVEEEDEEEEEEQETKPAQTNSKIAEDIKPEDVPAIDLRSSNIAQLQKGGWFVEL